MLIMKVDLLLAMVGVTLCSVPKLLGDMLPGLAEHPGFLAVDLLLSVSHLAICINHIRSRHRSEHKDND
jgi:hypothetical protein